MVFCLWRFLSTWWDGCVFVSLVPSFSLLCSSPLGKQITVHIIAVLSMEMYIFFFLVSSISNSAVTNILMHIFWQT